MQHIGGMQDGTHKNKKKNKMFDYIEGSKFITISDVRYCFDNSYYSHAVFENTLNESNINSINKDFIIVYTNTHWVESLFQELSKIKTDKKFILITHNSDHELNEVVYRMKPDNVVKWFSQNINYLSEKNDIESIPIGLENPKWFTDSNKISNILLTLEKEKENKNLMYVNHTIRSYPLERTEPYELFSDKSWSTVEFYENGTNFNTYINNVYNHKFVLCPRGNGLDTHRFWETLYLKSIPIVKRNYNNTYFKDLPVVYVDNWNEINEDFLNYEYDRINNSKFNLDKLNFEYWKNKIIKFKL
jgi:hypothetical protein